MEEGIVKENILEKVDNISLNPYQYSPLALAYIGDSVLDLLVKRYFVVNTNKQTYKYHKEVTNIVKAVNQADFIDKKILDILSKIENKEEPVPSYIIISDIALTEKTCEILEEFSDKYNKYRSSIDNKIEPFIRQSKRYIV